MIYGIIGGLFVGIICTVFLFKSLDKMDRFRTREWFKGAIIGGIIIIGLCTYWFGSLGFEWETECKIDKTIKDTLKANYDNVTNYHNDYDNKSFFTDNSKYTFDYDEETKILIVFTNTESSVDAVFVDGVKQTDQNISDNTDKILKITLLTNHHPQHPRLQNCRRKYRTKYNPDIMGLC